VGDKIAGVWKTGVADAGVLEPGTRFIQQSVHGDREPGSQRSRPRCPGQFTVRIIRAIWLRPRCDPGLRSELQTFQNKQAAGEKKRKYASGHLERGGNTDCLTRGVELLRMKAPFFEIASALRIWQFGRRRRNGRPRVIGAESGCVCFVGERTANAR